MNSAPQCRSCGVVLKDPFLSLGKTPLSNAFLSQEQLHRPESYYPLEVYHCFKCHLVQLDAFCEARDIFSSDYAYFSSFSDSWLDHCKRYAEMIVDRFHIGPKSFVVEIASNDGYLLQYFKKRKIPILGVEPARNVAKRAMARGIPTDVSFFSANYARKLVKKCGRADLIIGNNVFAHCPNLTDFVAGLATALKPQGVVTLEFPHLLELLRGNQFDTIYHEHFCYFSLHAVRRLLRAHRLECFDVDLLKTHGGSLRLYVKHSGDRTKTVTPRISALLDRERSAGLLEGKTYERFRIKVESIKRDLLSFLLEAKRRKKRVVGYGAPAKGNTLLNYCGIRSDLLEYTVDRSPHKQGKFLPGTHLPVRHPGWLKRDRPDYVLILPWNIRNEIMEQMSFIRKWGGQFVVAIPKLELLKPF